MTFQEWFDEEIEVFSLRSERFFNDCDHHREGSAGSYARMEKWLEAAYWAGIDHEYQRNLEAGGGTL